jgi:hypothetical protein
VVLRVCFAATRDSTGNSGNYRRNHSSNALGIKGGVAPRGRVVALCRSGQPSRHARGEYRLQIGAQQAEIRRNWRIVADAMTLSIVGECFPSRW